jgi:signal transduction histidine kinase
LFKSLRYEWTAPGQNPDIEKPIYQNVPVHGTGFERYYQTLDQGAPFVGSTSYFTDVERKRFELSGIKALLEMQIFIDGKPWGIIGFDETEHEREWTAAEVDVIRVAANVLGSAIKRQMDEASLQNELTQRKLLIEELKLRNAESETLRETTAIVASALDISEAIHRILEQLKRMVYYDSASVWLYRGNQAVMVGYDGLPPDAILPGYYELDDTQPDYPLRVDYVPYILINDIQELYTGFQTQSLSYIHGWMAVPLRARGALIGFISLDGRAVGQFSEHDAQMTLTYANQVSIALENARLISDLQAELEARKKLVAELKLRNEESETLRESVAIVAATLEQSEAVDRILEQLERVVHYDSASVQLLNGNMLEIVSSRGLDFIRDDIGVQFPLNDAEPSYSVLKGLVPYVLYHDVQISISAFNDIPHNDIHAWMAVPLKVKGQIIGIIALDGHQAGQFTERDALLAVTYANQVAVALENARLFGELQVKFAERQQLIEELENKNAELERFTYTVSHDLRSPLVTIKGFLGYLERSASSGNMDSFRKDMARISSATDRMDRLLKDVLELSRIGRLVNQAIDVPFDELAREAAEIVHGRLAARGIALQILSPVGTQPNLPLVHVDRPRLIEVLQNLIDNAAKYMGTAQEHPLIEIGMQAYDKSGAPIFFVRDNGMGIEPQYHERIFRLFDKLDPSSEGTGIGLALVKRIIEFHGGRIWVESQAGKGSTFYFTLQNSLQV